MKPKWLQVNKMKQNLLYVKIKIKKMKLITITKKKMTGRWDE